jgi:hypothetical protein
MFIPDKEIVFPKLLDNTSVPPEDKQNIRELLKKPWNPYVVGRHATLTQKSRQLKEATLRFLRDGHLILICRKDMFTYLEMLLVRIS